MKTFLLSFAGALAALIITIFASVIFVSSLIAASTMPPPQPTNMVLTVDLRQVLPDKGGRGIEGLLGTSNGFIDMIEKIGRAKTDPSVKGMFIRNSEGAYGSARAEELRAALADFQDAGKFVIVHTQDNYAMGPSGYRAISASDEIWMQPGTDLFMSGIAFETMFYKDLLDKISVKSEIQALYEYKNAPNQYNESTYTAPHREAMTALGQSLWDTSLDDIATDRNIDRDQLVAGLSNGPLPVLTAQQIGLVDEIGYPEEAQEAAKARADNASFMKISAYRPPAVPNSAPTIAVVAGEGGIITGPRVPTVFSPDPVMSSDVIAREILKAGKDDDVKAIVFRVDSPGGSATASDQIWRAIERVQEMGKPVVVSMGTYAASGGYYVSTGADYIIANATTITGSIGIFGGKIAIADGLREIGINTEAIIIGDEFANAFGAGTFTDRQRQLMRDWLERGYDRFVGHVAEGRNMELEQVREIAKGRVWSGADALEVGLVDEIGGIADAINKAKELAEISAETDVKIVYYPKAQGTFESLGLAASASAEAAEATGTLVTLLNDPRVQQVLSEIETSKAKGARAAVPVLSEQ